MLDINTPKGQESLKHEADAIDLFMSSRPEMSYVRTASDGSAFADGLLVKNGVVKGVCEIKCRDMDVATLNGPFKGEWLISHSKLTDLANCARLLQVPAIGLLYLTKDQTLLAIRVANSKGELTPEMRLSRTKTAASCNGGDALRTNAFIRMADARVLRFPVEGAA